MDNKSDAYQEHYDSIKKEFSKQAPRWGREQIGPHLPSIVARWELQPHHVTLDVAAGSGLLARTISPLVKQVTAVDITPAMMQSANLQGITNINFQQGAAEDLPFPNDTFDVVATRFSLHHFLQPSVAVREMRRVCRPGGRVFIIDLVSSEDERRADHYNELERLRDPTHTTALSFSGLKRVVEENGLRILDAYAVEDEVDLEYWLEICDSPESRRQIVEEMNRELEGEGETGMRPFKRGDQLMFMHNWGIIEAQK